MTWQRFLLGLASICFFLGLAGCTQTCFHKECDWADVYQRGAIPLSLESETSATIAPVIPNTSAPATVTSPERTPLYLSLQDALAMALENGTVGVQSVRTPGLVSDELASFAGRGFIGSDAVRVLALEPAVAGAAIENALARFDAVWGTSMGWNMTDEPTQGLSSFQNGQGANFATTLAKPLATGGVAGITFATDYSLLSNPPVGGLFSVLNPSYTSRLQVGFEQPLLKGYGVDINQLLPGLPGSTLFPTVNGRGTSEGILITRLRFDQQRADFKRAIHYQVLNVEAAYWTLYGSYVTLYAAEQGLRQTHAAWIIGKARLEAGIIDKSEFALVRAQYEQFRAERMRALGTVLDNERTLRVLLGLEVEDGKRLVPVDAPTLTPYQPNWESALRDCLTLRPELVVAREELQARHMQLLAQKNGLLPDLRFHANYSAVGLGSRLDGRGTTINSLGQPVFNNSLASLTGDSFNDWTVGLKLNVPIGYRSEYASVRAARLQLAQSYHLLKDQERRAQTFLAKQYSRVIETFKLIEINRLAREALAEQLEIRFRKYALGDKKSTLEFMLDAQKQWANALNQEYQAIVDYNIALASFEFARGTILDRNKVVIGEGPLPACAQVRAVDQQRERTRAIVLREKSNPVVHPPCTPTQLSIGIPQWPANQAPTLPALLEGAPAVPASLEQAGLSVAREPNKLPAAVIAPPASALPAASALQATPPALFPPPLPPTPTRPAPPRLPPLLTLPLLRPDNAGSAVRDVIPPATRPQAVSPPPQGARFGVPVESDDRK